MRGKKIKFFTIFISFLTIVSLMVVYKLSPFLLIKNIPIANAIWGGTPSLNSNNIYWANKILDGGYILYFRHAEREKWSTVTSFDFFEVQYGLDGRSQTWSEGVCLTKKGVEESKLLGMVFKELNMNFNKIVASKSCRARETALYSFGQIDETWMSLLHSTAVPDHQENAMQLDLKEKLKGLTVIPGSNVFVVGHGRTLDTYQESLFDRVEIDEEKFPIEELGFFVIESKDNSLILRHAFTNFTDFAEQVLDYNIMFLN